jgi:hypothetical protein
LLEKSLEWNARTLVQLIKTNVETVRDVGFPHFF